LKTGRSWLLNVSLIAVLVVLALVGRKYSPLLLAKRDVVGVAEAGCNLQRQACPALLPDGGRVLLSIAPRPIPLLHALHIEVVTRGIEARKMEIDFSGADMNMGYNRTQLAAAGAGRNTGEASLPVCVSGDMAWVATVLIETDRQRIAVPFRFDTRR